MHRTEIDLSTGEQRVIELTPEEIAQMQAQEEARIAAIPYDEKRRAEYPDFREYLDGIVKGDAAQVQRYIDACLAVKAKYPKP